jgi:hypothetical protein
MAEHVAERQQRRSLGMGLEPQNDLHLLGKRAFLHCIWSIDMKPRLLTALTLFVVAACVIAPPAFAQPATPQGAAGATLAESPTPAPTPLPTDVQELARGVFDWSFLVVLVVAVTAGALGGLVYELLILQGSLERPHRLTEEEVTEGFPYAVPKHMFDLGIWARVIIGALAAVAALVVFSPNSALELVAMAIIAGSAGTAVFRSLQDRLTAALAQTEAANARLATARMAAKIDEANQTLAPVRNMITRQSISTPGATELAATPKRSLLDLAELDKVEQLLNEAKGIYVAVQR